MNKYLIFVGRYPRAILVTLVLITLYFGFKAMDLTEDSNPYLLPDTHPARSSLLEMREEFTGTYDSIMIALYNKDTIFNEHTLKAFYELTKRVRTLSFVEEADEDRLQLIRQRYPRNAELTAAIDQILKSGLDQQDVYPLRRITADAQAWSISKLDKKFFKVLSERLDPIREMAGISASENIFLEADGTLRAAITVDDTDADIAKVRDAVKANELMDDGIVDRQGKVGLIVLEISVLQDDAEGQLRAYEAVSTLVAEYQQKHPLLDDDIYIGGVPAFFAEQKKIMDADLATLFPAVIVLVSAILAMFFRSALGVLIPLTNVIMCIVWTFGSMAILGIPLDLITAALPVFLTTICSSDAIHMMAEYYHQRRSQADQTRVVQMTMRLMVSPVILTTLTTCITFAVSTTTSISNLRNFGISMSFGMFVAMIISLLLIPAWLTLLGDKKLKTIAHHQRKPYLISTILLRLIKPVMSYRRGFLIGFSVCVGLLIVVAFQVRIDDMGSGYFKKDNAYRVADDFINSHIAGTSPGWIEVDTGVADGALTRDAVAFIDELEKFIHQQENITYSYSIARYIRRINYVFNNMDASYNRLPNEVEYFTEIDDKTGKEIKIGIAGADIIRQAVLMYENGGGSDLTNVLSENFSKTLLLYTMNTTVASDFQRFLDQLNPWLTQNTPPGMKVKLAGQPVIWTAVLDELISSQMQSISLALVCVILVMAFWMRSLRMGLLGTLPLVTTVVFYFAMMTLFNIELNIGTAIISFLVLGVVDYSVHYLLRTQNGLRRGLSLDQALEAAITHSGRSIVVNVIVFSVGFVALLFSDFRPIVDLGLLVGLSLFISGVMSVFIITLLAPWLIPKERCKRALGRLEMMN